MDADVTVSAARPTVPARRGLRLCDAAPPLTGAGIWPASRYPVTRDPALAFPERRARPGNGGQLVSGERVTGIGFRALLPKQTFRSAPRRVCIQPPGRRKRGEGGDCSLHLRRSHTGRGWGESAEEAERGA